MAPDPDVWFIDGIGLSLVAGLVWVIASGGGGSVELENGGTRPTGWTEAATVLVFAAVVAVTVAGVSAVDDVEPGRIVEAVLVMEVEALVGVEDEVLADVPDPDSGVSGSSPSLINLR